MELTERGADGVSALGKDRGHRSRAAREDRDGQARYSVHKATDGHTIRKQGGTVELIYFTPDKFRGEFLFAPKMTGVEPRRSTRALFGAFRLVVVALRQQGFLRLAENPSKIAPRGVRSSFWRADLCPGQEKPAGNTSVLSRALTPHGRKSAARNRCGSTPVILRKERFYVRRKSVHL